MNATKDQEKSFNVWLRTFIEEKGLDLEGSVIEFEDHNGWNYIPLCVVVEFLEQLDTAMQHTIKTKIVQIDFHNGKMMHFFEYITKEMTKSTQF